MIESSDILQVDATIIAGILILLTITSFKILKTKPSMLAAMVIIPFSASAIIELLKANPMVSGSLIDLLSVAFPVIGFVYVAIVIGILARSERKNKEE